MKLSANQNSRGFTPCPEYTGPAVCVDVTPPEKHETQYGTKERFRIVFEVPIQNENGDGNYTVSEFVTPSLHEKAKLRKFLKQWRGRDLTAQEMQEFDTESLIGMPAFLVVTHSQSDDGEKTYANIVACTPHKGEPVAPCGNYIRVKDREQREKGGYARAANPAKTAESQEVNKESWMSTKVHVGTHKGTVIGDLDEVAIGKLVEKWLPAAKASPKQTADDKRLIAALELAWAELQGADETAEEGY